MNTPQASWYFDYVSPYAYLQAELLAQRSLPANIQPQPILFAALLNHHGHKGPAEIPAKRRFIYRHVSWLATGHQLPLRFPAGHPFNPLPLLRLTLAAGSDWQTVRRIFRFVWVQGELPEPGPAFDGLLADLGVEAARLSAPEIKSGLIDATAAAVERGVFGVPTLAIDDQLFWGLDATGMFEDYLRHPESLDSPELRRLDNLPQAATR